MRKHRPQIVELTSKPLKVHAALSGILLMVGLVAGFGGFAPGYLLAFLGFIWHTVTRIRIWWNHG